MWYHATFKNFGQAMVFYKKDKELGYKVEFKRLGEHYYEVWTWIDD